MGVSFITSISWISIIQICTLQVCQDFIINTENENIKNIQDIFLVFLKLSKSLTDYFIWQTVLFLEYKTFKYLGKQNEVFNVLKVYNIFKLFKTFFSVCHCIQLLTFIIKKT